MQCLVGCETARGLRLAARRAALRAFVRRAPSAALSLGVGLGLALLAAVLPGCDVHFVEGSPPKLEPIVRRYEATAIQEPVVYGLVFDLQIASATECERFQRALRESFHDAMLPAGRVGRALPEQDVSPGCSQSPSRVLDLAALLEAWQAAKSEFASHQVRAVFLYLNNSTLPLPEELRSQLASLRGLESDVALTPELWAIAVSEPAGVGFDSVIPWTHSGDEALLLALRTLVSARVPFMSLRGARSERMPLLTTQELSSVTELKSCSQSSWVQSFGFAQDGLAAPVDAHSPPQYQVTLPEQRAVPNALFVSPQVVVRIEACHHSCDRYVEGTGRLFRWNEVQGCLLDFEDALEESREEER